MTAARDIVVVHSSDLHLAPERHGGGLDSLAAVLHTADAVAADAVLLAGDIFDHNRVPLSLLDRAARLLADAVLPVVILPGNHDCLVPDSVYRRGGLADPANVWVLGVSAEESVELPHLDLEVWGRAHQDYGDMSPLARPRPSSTRLQIAMAHGHWVQGPHDLHRSYLIHDREIAALSADYLALGHWDRALSVGDGTIPAYYSGAPDYAGTVNVVRFSPDGAVRVTREPLAREDQSQEGRENPNSPARSARPADETAQARGQVMAGGSACPRPGPTPSASAPQPPPPAGRRGRSPA